MTGPQYLGTMDDWMRDQEKRVRSVERRRPKTTLALASQVPASGADLNNAPFLEDGLWLIDTFALANTMKNLPAPPLPATATNVAPNPTAWSSLAVMSTTTNAAYWAVSRGVTTQPATAAGTASSDMVQPAGTPVGSGLIASVQNVDGLANTYYTARTVHATVRANVDAEYELGLSGVWVPFAANTWVVTADFTVAANTYAYLRVRRAGGALPTTADRAYITDVYASPGAGSVRSGSIGTLEVVTTPSRVIQTFQMLLALTGSPLTFTYQRVRSGDGVTWGPWVLKDRHIPVASTAEINTLARSMATTARSPLVLRVTSGFPQYEVSTQDGNSWQIDWAYGQNTTWTASPLVTALPLNAPWANYGGGFAGAAYYRSVEGIVWLRGLVKTGTIGSTIATLPVGYRPAGKRMFQVGGAGTGDASCRVDVMDDGSIIMRAVNGLASGAVPYVSLSGIAFPCAEVAPHEAWTPVTMANSFYSYSTVDPAWPVASYWEDHVGRLWLRGLAGRATSPAGADTAYASVPAKYVPAKMQHLSGVSNLNTFSSQDFGNAGVANLRWKTTGGHGYTFFSLPTAPIVPAAIESKGSYALMTPLLNSWVNYDTIVGNPGLYPYAAVWRAPDGFIHMRGLIANGTVGQDIAALGPGDRAEPELHIFSAPASEQFSRDDIYQTSVKALAGATGWRSLDTIFYLREA